MGSTCMTLVKKKEFADSVNLHTSQWLINTISEDGAVTKTLTDVTTHPTWSSG